MSGRTFSKILASEEKAIATTVLDMPRSRDLTEKIDWREKWLASRKTRSVHRLQALRAGTKPRRTSHHRVPGGVRRRKCWTIFLERTRKGHCQSDQGWNCFKGRQRAIVSQTNVGPVSKDDKGPFSVRSTLELFQRTRKGHRQSDQRWN